MARVAAANGTLLNVDSWNKPKPQDHVYGIHYTLHSWTDGFWYWRCETCGLWVDDNHIRSNRHQNKVNWMRNNVEQAGVPYGQRQPPLADAVVELAAAAVALQFALPSGPFGVPFASWTQQTPPAASAPAAGPVGPRPPPAPQQPAHGWSAGSWWAPGNQPTATQQLQLQPPSPPAPGLDDGWRACRSAPAASSGNDNDVCKSVSNLSDKVETLTEAVHDGIQSLNVQVDMLREKLGKLEEEVAKQQRKSPTTSQGSVGDGSWVADLSVSGGGS